MSLAEQQFTKNGLLLIGSQSTLNPLVTGFRDSRSVQPIPHASYVMPPESLLRCVTVVLVFDIDERQRFQQLRCCCEHQRSQGGIRTVFGFSSKLDPRLAELVRATGAEFVPLNHINPREPRSAETLNNGV